MKPSDTFDESEPVEVRQVRRGKKIRDDLLVDGESVPYGRLFDGTYFAYEDAYSWADSLEELGASVLRARRARSDLDRGAGTGREPGDGPA